MRDRGITDVFSQQLEEIRRQQAGAMKDRSCTGLFSQQLKEIHKEQAAIRAAQKDFTAGRRPFRDQLENLARLSQARRTWFCGKSIEEGGGSRLFYRPKFDAKNGLH